MVRDALAGVAARDRRRASSSAARRSCAAARELRRPARGLASRRRSPSTPRTSSSTSRTSRCSGRPRGFRLAARALALGVPYEGADFRLDPPRFEPIGTPSLAVIGTGKRVGKTAVTGHVGARRLARTGSVVVVAMGRGGPAEPELVEARPDGRRPARALARGTPRGLRPPRDGGADRAADRRLPPLRRRSRGRGRALERPRRHAARRGARPGPDRARRERRRDPADRGRPAHPRRRRPPGSRASRPATSTPTARCSPISSSSRWPRTSVDARRARRRRFRGLTRPGVPIVRAVLRPRPLDDVRGQRVAFFGTAPPAQHERDRARISRTTYGARGRPRLRQPLRPRGARAELATGSTPTRVVVEVKAAAIDVVAEEADRAGNPGRARRERRRAASRRARSRRARRAARRGGDSTATVGV